MQKLYLNELAGKMLMNGESARILRQKLLPSGRGTVPAKTEKDHAHPYSVQPWLNTAQK